VKGIRAKALTIIITLFLTVAYSVYGLPRRGVVTDKVMKHCWWRHWFDSAD